MSMNDISVKIEQLLKLQQTVCEQYEKEKKELLRTIKAQEEQIRLLKQLIENQDKIIKALEQS
jgi:predicted RNase H-like nuclease (RuvC/YqgF family)